MQPNHCLGRTWESTFPIHSLQILKNTQQRNALDRWPEPGHPCSVKWSFLSMLLFHEVFCGWISLIFDGKLVACHYWNNCGCSEGSWLTELSYHLLFKKTQRKRCQTTYTPHSWPPYPVVLFQAQYLHHRHHHLSHHLGQTVAQSSQCEDLHLDNTHAKKVLKKKLQVAFQQYLKYALEVWIANLLTFSYSS